MSSETFFRTTNVERYRQWILEYEQETPQGIDRLRQAARTASFQPSFGIVPILAEQTTSHEREIFSRKLQDQLYGDWRIFSSPGAMQQSLLEAAANTDFVLPLPLDAMLHREALARFVLALHQVADADILFADEDVLRRGKRAQPWFKPDWDEYFMLGRNCVGVPAIYRSEMVLRMQALPAPSTTVDNFLYALALQASAATSRDRIHHIPAVLCHRTAEPDWDRSQAAEAVREHLAQKGCNITEISPAPLAPHYNRVRFSLPTPAPMVSIIVPTKDRAELIGPCIESVLQRTDYPSLELIIVDNGTTASDALDVLETARKDARVLVLRDDRAFNFSRLNNEAAKHAHGEILLLLNNDTKVIHSDWLTEMASLASRPDVGVVGARLLYPDLRVQHAGVCFGDHPVPYHQMRLAAHDEAGPDGELALLRRSWAVTGACLALRKDLYFEVGGLDERNFAVAFNDIDLCLKIAQKGLAVLCTPYAELLHFESVSRGAPTTPQQAEREFGELRAFWSKHNALYETPDPYYNPQVDQREGYVDFARPPRLNRFRPSFERQTLSTPTY
jgi:GT2 family glycosyltransferase